MKRNSSCSVIKGYYSEKFDNNRKSKSSVPCIKKLFQGSTINKKYLQ